MTPHDEDVAGVPTDTWAAPPPWQLPHAVRRLYGRDSELGWLDRALLRISGRADLRADERGPGALESAEAERADGVSEIAEPTGDTQVDHRPVGDAPVDHRPVGDPPVNQGPSETPSSGRDRDAGCGSSPIAVLEGMGGVGKTALAVAWGHRHRDRFPDGQLFADLGGYGPGAPVEPSQVLAVFVRALGAMPQAIPADSDGLASLFRTLCADRRMLVLLDNAAEPEQVRPLLPAAPGVAVVVTSRSTLAGLSVRDDAQRLGIQPLPEEDAVALLGREVGALPSDALHRLAAACGNLPLALRLVSSRLTTDPHDVQLTRLVNRANGTEPVLDADRAGANAAALLAALTDRSDPYSDLSAVLSWSLSRSSPAERRAVLLLSASPSRRVDDHAAAALIGLPVAPVRQLLAGLAQRHLLERSQPGSWLLHDLVRAWARGEADRTLGLRQIREAQRRALGYYLWAADAADRALLPQRNRPPLDCRLPKPLSLPRFGDPADALAWGDATLSDIVEAAAAAQASGEHDCAAALPHILLSYLNLRKPWAQWLALCRVGLAAAADDPMATANLHIAVGIAHRETRQLDLAVQDLTAAVAAFRTAGHVVGVAMALNNLATAHQESGRPGDARTALRQAVHELAGVDDSYRRAIVLHNLAEAEIDLGELGAAVEHAAAALAEALQADDRLGAAATRTTIGRVQMLLGRIDLAEAEFEAALAVQRQAGDLLGQATTQRHLGRMLIQTDRPDEAQEHLTEALGILADLGDPAEAEVDQLLAEAKEALALGEPEPLRPDGHGEWP